MRHADIADKANRNNEIVGAMIAMPSATWNLDQCELSLLNGPLALAEAR